MKQVGRKKWDLKNKESACPYCGDILNLASPATNKALNHQPNGPEAGSISICLTCGNIGQYGKDLKLEKTPEGELEMLKIHKPKTYNKLKEIQHSIFDIIIERTILDLKKK